MESRDQCKEKAEKKMSESSSRRCGQIGEGDDDELSMVDVLNEEARLRADANAVLGGSDAHNCTYPKGPLKRQALYSCVTCTPDGKAGVCLACSYACHEGHELIELYTKRHFTCDCGNEKFGDKNCKLYKSKKILNASNRYNQNFKGIYCSCHRPYPDPEDTTEDEMIQCVICEDWYHGRHLLTTVPEEDDYQEMICPDCMNKYSFLWAYYVKKEAIKVESADTDQDIDPGVSPSLDQHGSANAQNDSCDTVVSPACNGKRPCDKDEKTEPPHKVSKMEPAADTEHGSDSKANDESGEIKDCITKALQTRAVDHLEEATFWPEGWRGKLCRCGDCMTMYKDRDIEYLLDEQDTVEAYELRGREQSTETEEVDEARALAGMDRVQQIEMVRGFMDLKSELSEFLQGFAREGKVVTEADIRDFFQRMNQKRRRNIQVPQPHCH